MEKSKNSIRRSVRLEYYKVIYRNKDDEDYSKIADAAYDILPLLEYIENKDIDERTIAYYQDYVRLEKIYVFREDRKIAASFLRLRETGIPKITTYNDLSKELDLKDDEYIGEDVSILYDPVLNVMSIQRNIHSLGISGLEKYLNHYLEERDGISNNIQIFLRPIVPINIQRKIVNAEYVRSINLRLCEFDTNRVLAGSRTFKELLNLGRNLDGSNMEIEINVGYKRNKGLIKSEIEDIMEEIDVLNHAQDGTITKARMKIKEDEDSRVEEVDLFTDKLNDRVYVWVEKRESLNSEYFSKIMLDTYKISEGKIREALGC